VGVSGGPADTLPAPAPLPHPQAPTTHTVLEIVKQRWGTGPHIVFLVFCLLTNIIVTSMLILGGASVVNALTGGERRPARGAAPATLPARLPCPLGGTHRPPSLPDPSPPCSRPK
jgi:hypothetical protein